jgi:hypothetical protein
MIHGTLEQADGFIEHFDGDREGVPRGREGSV